MPVVSPQAAPPAPRPPLDCRGRVSQPAIRWLRRTLWLAVATLLLTLGAPSHFGLTERAAALPAPLPRLPAGYTMETRGEVRWTYPSRADTLSASLMAATPEIWSQLERALGTIPSDALDIRIAVNPDDMRTLSGGRRLPEYATGVAFPGEGLILLSLTAPDTWMRPDMRQLLTHELAHVALHRAVAGHPIPRWFTEGVAIHMAGERNLARVRTLWTGTVQRRLIRLEHLSNAFPDRHGEVDLAYAQSADLVRHMLDGRDERARFRQLIALLHDGHAFADAVPAAYHVSLGYLEREWRSQIQRRFGRWPSVLIGLTGLWGLAALVLIAAYVRARVRHRRTLSRWAEEERAQDAADATAATVSVLPRGTSLAVASASSSGPPADDAAQPIAGSAVDRLIERAGVRADRDPDVPSVEHEGRNYTLH